MTYAAQETAVQTSQPIYLYQFVRDTQEWTYTNRATSFTWNSKVWQPSAIMHSNIVASVEMAKHTLSLTFTRTHEFAHPFLTYSPDAITFITIFRGHTTDFDAEFITYWKGRVLNAKVSGNTITLECEPVYTSLRRIGLRARYQRTCRHALYGRGCTLNQANFADAGLLLTAVVGTTLTVPGADVKPDGWYFGGMIETQNGVLRFIIGHIGATITISQPIENFVSVGYGESYGTNYGGVALTLYPGCDRTTETCTTKFNNFINYGGFPWLPTRNPFDGNSIV